MIYSAYTDGVLASAAVVAEADAIVSKGCLGSELCEAIRKVARGHQLLPPVPEWLGEALRRRLDHQEQAIFGLLLAGIKPPEIAGTLGVPEAALESRLWSMLRKLEAVDPSPNGRSQRRRCRGESLEWSGAPEVTGAEHRPGTRLPHDPAEDPDPARGRSCVVRDGLRMLLDAEPDLRVVAQAGDGAEAVTAGLVEDIDLAILDVAMPRMTGLHAAGELKRRHPEIRILILSMHENEQYLYEALKAGASGYVVKTIADRDLVGACRAAVFGEPFLYPGATAALIREYLIRREDDRARRRGCPKRSGSCRL